MASLSAGDNTVPNILIIKFRLDVKHSTLDSLVCFFGYLKLTVFNCQNFINTLRVIVQTLNGNEQT
jgi:hypothetical protein